jgi:hypothetical protein
MLDVVKETVARMIERGGPDHAREEISLSTADKETKEMCYKIVDEYDNKKSISMAENGDLDDYEGGM